MLRRSAARPERVAGVASERDIPRCISTVWRSPTSALDANKVSGKQLHVGETHVALVLSRENLHQEEQLRANVKARFGNRVRLLDTHGAVSVVGAGINASFENVRRGTAALGDLGVEVDGVATSSFRITWLIDRARLDDAVRLLHVTFIESAQLPVP